MSKKLADTIALALIKHSDTRHPLPVLSYGLQILINTLIKIVMITIIGWVLHILLELYIMIFFFGSFRMITGGVHAHTFFKCLTISLVSFVLLILLSSYTLPFFIENKFIILLSLFLFGTMITWLYVPARWGNRRFSKKRITVSKWLSISYLALILLSVWCIPAHSTINKLQEISWIAVMGITWQCILVTPWGYALFDRIERITLLKGGDNNVAKNEG
ncbi:MULTISPECIES: accessory gene regulator ArgB-like protein [Aneurinibacillus]|uniref:Accessory gene regulator B family protein n=1 Tax=Aneurinibacillus thermoaerophilus TaxID=143495 RepID=A0A1G7Y585_ANETH|nr:MULTISPECIES: accessory gene regulator B family protein [Aneurinibacillus]AMA72861.1 hypothetical protein ACH33_08340 [Aneurinibacillus sp. XH2]MED0677642.1 accessory gene regulator B family protein [Aneurinibacillus thermoaerophilus]MED0680052.1 accessory gene regulator B family protein [Aneurinibacillus thermoaerophilus]MED0736773.1 accessory gene regulator B family protein [Aneurinibacillus thermoaerophilus]MED0758193.1 accessory gene regulator B family protein [Aneurinibacillus thermoae